MTALAVQFVWQDATLKPRQFLNNFPVCFLSHIFFHSPFHCCCCLGVALFNFSFLLLSYYLLVFQLNGLAMVCSQSGTGKEVLGVGGMA